MDRDSYTEEVYRDHVIKIKWEEYAENPREAFCMCSEELRSRRRPEGPEELANYLINNITAQQYLVPCGDPECEECSDPKYPCDFCDSAHDAARLAALEDLYVYANTSNFWRDCYGWTYVPLGTPDTPNREAAEKILQGEISTMRAYYQGEVFSWTVDGPECDDSCWGFYGDGEVSYMIQEARKAVDYALEKAAEAAEIDAIYCGGNGD